MSHAGFFLYTGDYLKDTRVLTLPARGAWADALCFLNEHGGSVTWPLSSFAIFWGVSLEQAGLILEELRVTGVADVFYQNPNKTLTKLNNRRMIRWFEKQEQIKKVRSEAGKKGMASRYNKSNSLPSLNPSLLTHLGKNHKNDSPRSQNFPEEWKWLEVMIRSQNSGFPIERFLDFAWWDAVSYQCGGLSAPFLEKELAGMKRWIMDNPTRTPTPRGYRRFVASWLERAHDKERRFNNATTKR